VDTSGNNRVMNLGPQATWAYGNKWDPGITPQDWAVNLEGLQTSTSGDHRLGAKLHQTCAIA
jgi:hypothetical protein